MPTKHPVEPVLFSLGRNSNMKFKLPWKKRKLKSRAVNQEVQSLPMGPRPFKPLSARVMFDSRIIPNTFFEDYGALLDAFSEQESPSIKTWSRIVVEKYLSKVRKNIDLFAARELETQSVIDHLFFSNVVVMVLSKTIPAKRPRSALFGQSLGLL